MKERNSKYYLSHMAVRLIAAANLVWFVLAVALPAYRYGVYRISPNVVVLAWFCLSSMLLPAYAVFEIFWMLKDSLAERKAVLIDASLAVACFATLAFGILYLMVHPVWL